MKPKTKARLKWHLAKYLPLSSPAHIDIELSTKCKLNCEFCFRKEYKYPAMDMDLNLFIDIINQAKELNIPSIKFNWRGEALEHNNWIIMILTAKTAGFYTMLNTSLTGRLYNLSLYVLAKYIDNLKISFDSSSEKIYNEIRKGADFFQTLSNLDKLIAYRKQYNMPKVILNRRTTVISEPDEAFKEFFGDEVDYDIRPAMDRNQQKIYEEGLRNRDRKFCGQPTNRMVINVDGDCYMCCVAYACQPELYLGNIKEQSLKELWNNPKRKQLIKDLRNNKLNNACLNCTSGEAYK